MEGCHALHRRLYFNFPREGYPFGSERFSLPAFKRLSKLALLAWPLCFVCTVITSVFNKALQVQQHCGCLLTVRGPRKARRNKCA